MENYNQFLIEEKKYLQSTLILIKNEIEKELSRLEDRRRELLFSRKEMWENTVHFSTDFERLTEISQYLSVLESQTVAYGSTTKKIEKYRKMLSAPYFGRLDFIEDGEDGFEKIYIGIHSLIEPENYEIIVYDWRAPIASIYYEYGVGKAKYQSPQKTVEGDVLLKRQYKIKNGELKYFFDCNLKIDDEILQQVLSSNTSTKMKNIVETIQREQNRVIRDREHDLLIVQGLAGSGKTSVALHRIAFLLYQGFQSKLNSNNIIIISPNEVFSQYISRVLPELGEENVEQMIFDGMISKSLRKRLDFENRYEQLERIILMDNLGDKKKNRFIEFKGSNEFAEIIRRWMTYYQYNHIFFEDVYYDGKIIETKQRLKNQLLNDKTGMPPTKILKRMELILLNKIHPIRKKRIKKIEKLVQKMDGHELEIKSYARLLSIKESKRVLDGIRKFTEIDYFKVYKALFEDKKRFMQLAEGLEVPEDLEEMMDSTLEALEKNYIYYEDSCAIIYLKLLIEGSDMFTEIKHVVVDEAQDYAPIQYEILNQLFKESKFTVLGDIHQSIDKKGDMSLYRQIKSILNKNTTLQMTLNKSYRSTCEITTFSQNLLNNPPKIVEVNRHGLKPKIIYRENIEKLDCGIMEEIQKLKEEGYETIAIICRTKDQAKHTWRKMSNHIDIRLIDGSKDEIPTGVVVIPCHIAKGLEFDGVIVYNVNKANYKSEMDKRLLYIACTRALHRLTLYYTENRSLFLPVRETDE